MKEIIGSFAQQLKEATSIASKAKFTNYDRSINNVLISGLGGSGIGGTIVQDLTKLDAKVSITVNKTYEIPAFVDENSLVIISSYSGNTEETLHAFNQAIEANAKICCISSGGEVTEIAKRLGIDNMIVPGGNQPRAMLAYSLTGLMHVLSFHDIISPTFKKDWEKSIQSINENEVTIKAEALSLAKSLNGKTPILYGMDGYEGITIRFRQQLNENAKILLWHHIIPEMNHNELVGWTKNSNHQVIFLTNNSDSERLIKRTEICLEIIGKYTKTPISIKSMGENQIQNSLYWIHFGDWVSYYLSEIRDVDPIEVKVIDFLKSELAK